MGHSRQIETIYVANSLQQEFIYHALTQPEDNAYRVQLIFDYKQKLNIDNYIAAWKLAVLQYPILRTAFNWQKDIIQIIYKNAELNYKLVDLNDKLDVEQETYIRNLQEEDRGIAFDLTAPCLLRLYLIKKSETCYTLIKTAHHSIIDGWSEPILLKAVHDNYYNLQQKKNLEQNAIDDSYLMAQEYFVKHKSEAKKYWYDKVSIIEHTNNLNALLLDAKQDLDSVQLVKDDYEEKIILAEPLCLTLKSIARREGITLNSIIQFVWHKLIQVYTQDDNTIVGTTISGRDLPILGIEKSVGLYINTLPLIINWNNNSSVLEQIQYIHEEISNLNTYSFANLADLQQEGKRLFQSLFIFENYPSAESQNIFSEDVLIPEFKYALEKMNYPIGLVVYERDSKVVIGLKTGKQISTT